MLADKATAIFKGKIYVQKDAQKTDSKQTSKALLLSDTAFMNSQPALEIYADDVKCTHGSTTGPVDPNAELPPGHSAMTWDGNAEVAMS